MKKKKLCYRNGQQNTSGYISEINSKWVNSAEFKFESTPWIYISPASHCAQIIKNSSEWFWQMLWELYSQRCHLKGGTKLQGLQASCSFVKGYISIWTKWSSCKRVSIQGLKLEVNRSIIIQSAKCFYFTSGNKKEFCAQYQVFPCLLRFMEKRVVLEQMRLRTIWQPAGWSWGPQSTSVLRTKPKNRRIHVGGSPDGEGRPRRTCCLTERARLIAQLRLVDSGLREWAETDGEAVMLWLGRLTRCLGK